MSTIFRTLTFALAAMTAQAATASTQVTVGATAANRDAAIELALGDALVEALGSHVFSVSTKTGDSFNSMSTSVTAGRIDDFEVLEEYETFDGVHVRLSVNLTDQNLSRIAPKEIKTWEQRIDETHSLDMAQRTVGNYRRVLDEFLVGPRNQLNAGYAFVLRSYDARAVDTGSISGNIYVDVTVNQSWWNTYYHLVSVLAPQGSQVLDEGPLKVHRNVARVDLEKSGRVDRTLQYDLAHPLPVRLSVGGLTSQFILYKNALLISAQPMTLDTATNNHQVGQARRGEISMMKGNVAGGTAVVDRYKSALSCGSVVRYESAVYCGERFTIKIPFDARNESEVIEMMNEGLNAELNLFGSACEKDCDIFKEKTFHDMSESELIIEAIQSARSRNHRRY
ncbi:MULTISPECIES: hypothetical protein [unclassified Marinobacter]|uniref:hypothetical protein n=1 Tax=unclassified Marinobacter TaxID=83889 RepID=UPI000BF55C5F|nr:MULTISPECIES: hypothetical protein [unclassified Marinobacter]PFG08859.1 hypothetical protein ATI45_1191 [Marinobacter sp. LV10MA510-1]PFG54725.1 hypothetical protein ATG98_4020 [Marinobacter sp. LV10R520-4]